MDKLTQRFIGYRLVRFKKKIIIKKTGYEEGKQQKDREKDRD